MDSPSNRSPVPDWENVNSICGQLQQAMDNFIGKEQCEAFRPSIARAIAQARDDRKTADAPQPRAPAPQESREEPDFEVIPVRLTATEIARIAAGAKNF